ncbi:MAG: phosphatidylglycerophosphatase A [Bryobacteraceae bacterium]
MTRLAVAVATCFGCGYFPWGPGTAGSLAAIIIAFLLHAYAGAGRLTLLVITLALLLPAIWASTKTARLMNSKDPGVIVIDEVLGQWVTLLGATALVWKSFFAAFVLFRIFDIWKPWPVRNFEKLPGGAGIVTDDLAAGLCGALILYIGGALRLY